MIYRASSVDRTLRTGFRTDQRALLLPNSSPPNFPETPNNIPLISSRSEKKSPPRFRAYLAPLIDSPSPLDLRLLEGLYVTRSNRANPLPLGTFSPSAGYDRR